MELLYLTAAPEVIIMRLLTVSMGEDMSPAVMVTAHPRMKEAPTPASAPRSMGFRVSYRPKYIPLYMPWIPSLLRVLVYTSTRPLNCLSPPLPLASLANLETTILKNKYDR